tara:strand:- start:781 stop:969 length:189 start_codon:yes stop_codon:yes gene_type:complete
MFDDDWNPEETEVAETETEEEEDEALPKRRYQGGERALRDAERERYYDDAEDPDELTGMLSW